MFGLKKPKPAPVKTFEHEDVCLTSEKGLSRTFDDH
jgi:hypothetical protein